MSSEQLLRALGAVLRTAAAVDGPLDEYQRGQLLSASSIARNLAAEQAGAPAMLARAIDDLTAELVAEPVAGLDDLTAALAGVGDGRQLGAVLCELLRRLRTDASPAGDRLRAGTRAIVRRLVDAEVAALATVTR